MTGAAGITRFRGEAPISEELVKAVCVAAGRAHSRPARWLTVNEIYKRAKLGSGDFRNGFSAAFNGGLLESRAIGAVITPLGHSSDGYRLTDAGWELAGGKPLWL